MNTTTSTVNDPVCGMTIDPAEATGSSTDGGETCHFCSRGCQVKFDAAPASYAAHAENESCCFPPSTIACCKTSEACC